MTAFWDSTWDLCPIFSNQRFSQSMSKCWGFGMEIIFNVCFKLRHDPRLFVACCNLLAWWNVRLIIESRSFQRLRCLAMLRPWFCVAIAMPPSWHSMHSSDLYLCTFAGVLCCTLWHTVVTGSFFPICMMGAGLFWLLFFVVAAAVSDSLLYRIFLNHKGSKECVHPWGFCDASLHLKESHLLLKTWILAPIHGRGVKCESGWIYSCVHAGVLNLPQDQKMPTTMVDLLKVWIMFPSIRPD